MFHCGYIHASSVVEDTKVIQKLRKKPHGVDAVTLAPKTHTKERKGKVRVVKVSSLSVTCFGIHSMIIILNLHAPYMCTVA